MSAAHQTFSSERLLTHTPEDVWLDRRRILAFGIGASPDVAVGVAPTRLCKAGCCVAPAVTADAIFAVGALLIVSAAASLVRLREQSACGAPVVVVDCNEEVDTILDTMFR